MVTTLDSLAYTCHCRVSTYRRTEMKPSTLVTLAVTLFFLAMGVPLAAVGFLIAAAVVSAVMR